MRCAPFLLLALLAVSGASLAAEDVSYVIRPGDTPVAVAKVHRVSVASLLARNPGLDPRHLKVGDVLFVPAVPACAAPAAPSHPAPAGRPSDKAAILPDEEDPSVTYVVAPGDCPAAIAERFGIPLEALARANPGLDPRNLAVGRVLAIPDTRSAPPAPVVVTRPGDPARSAPLVMDFQ